MKKFVFIVLFVMVFNQIAYAGADGKKLKESFSYGGKGQIDFTNKMEQDYFSSVLSTYKAKNYNFSPINELTATPDNFVGGGELRNYEGKYAYFSDVKSGPLKVKFDLPESAVYEIEIEYFLVSDTGSAAKRSIKVDGKTPYFEANGLEFYRLFKDESEPAVNSVGDEVKPRQVEIRRWQTVSIEDSHGFYALPLSIYLEKGNHELEFEFVTEDMAIASISLKRPTLIKPYSPPKDNGVKMTPLRFEAESSVISKNDSTIRRESNSDPATSKNDPKLRKLNIIGDVAWSRGNQNLKWEFEVNKPGIYTISLRFQQIWLNGLPSYRKIEIDDKVPFEELLNYKFPYASGWQGQTLGDNNGSPYQFYFDKGIHTISMAIKFGPLTELVQSLNEDSYNMSNMMLEILRLTGGNPDPNFDYEFFTNIPTLKKNLQKLSNSLQIKYDYLVKIAKGNVPGFAYSIKATKKQLDLLIEDEFSIAKNTNTLSGIQASLGSWYSEFQTMPLSIDFFELNSPQDNFKIKKSTIFDKLYYMLISLVVSFTKDYDKIESKTATNSSKTINIWVARGTEWATLIKELSDTYFTPKSNVSINMNVMPASQLNAGAVNALMLSISSGKSPDIAIGVDPNSPVEFAIRDAVVDLSKLSDFTDVSKRFIPECMVPFKYRGGIYGLPETMDFRVMFYRNDIVSKLGIKIPDTRAELYENVLPALYQNGMNFYYPRDDTQFILQHGGKFYTDDGLKSSLDSFEAFEALKEETELYLEYGIPVSASFYNRFRSGEMPMGIGSFSDYMSILVAAPELSGKFSIAPLPGIRKENGEIDRSVGQITGQSTIILKNCSDLDASWEFVKWWTSDETQTVFGREIEALIGKSARWNSANITAFKKMPWAPKDLDVIVGMWKYYSEVPVVLGGYFTGRYLTNAWNSTVISGYNLRDSLETAVVEINRELKMKQEEYSVEDVNK